MFNKNLYNSILYYDSINNLNIEFNEEINEKYKNEQNFFCINQKYFSNINFENKIKKAKANFMNNSFEMFVYKEKDIVSEDIIKMGEHEGTDTNNILNALFYYSKKLKIKREDIYIIDVGANIGWYTFYLGIYGYNIISFEPSIINSYILKKNFCLNKYFNITIINKGLYNEDKKCDIYSRPDNEGNGYVICENANNNIIKNNFIKRGEIILTKLSNYIKFLSKKNLALIKIDVEGSEGKVIEGGIEIISKYHIPLIFMEFIPKALRLHDTEPQKLLQIFEDNDYKISTYSFLDKKYSSIEDIVKKFNNSQVNLYMVYSKFLN